MQVGEFMCMTYIFLFEKIKGSELGRITHTHKLYGTVGLIFLCSKKTTGYAYHYACLY